MDKMIIATIVSVVISSFAAIDEAVGGESEIFNAEAFSGLGSCSLGEDIFKE